MELKELLSTWGDLSKPKLYIGIPTTGTPKLATVMSLLQLQKHIILNTNIAAVIEPQESSMLVSKRAKIITNALTLGADYILWIDDDMRFYPSTFDILYKEIQKPGIDIVGCNYPTRVYPYLFTARHLNRGLRVFSGMLETGVVQVDFLGLGFCLMKTSILENLSRPFFRMDEDHGEDAFLFDKLHVEKGIRPYVSHDASHRISHIGEQDITFSEGRAKELQDSFVRQPTIEELYGELDDQADKEYTPLKHIT